MSGIQKTRKPRKQKRSLQARNLKLLEKRLSKAARSAPLSRDLTPEEIDALRKDMKDFSAWFDAWVDEHPDWLKEI